MEELKHGTEEMTQYILTFENGKQMRLFVSTEDQKDECSFMFNALKNSDVENIIRYSVETVTVE